MFKENYSKKNRRKLSNFFTKSHIKQKPGFTIIEMLIVISIIGVLATLSIGSYQDTRKSAELSLQIDAFMDEIRASKNQASKSNEKCYGLQVSTTGIQKIESDYLNPYYKCSNTILTSPSSLSIVADQIKRDQYTQESKEIDILFYPPLGETYLPGLDQVGQDSFETIFFKFRLSSKTNDQVISFNSSNSSIQKINSQPLVTKSNSSSNSSETVTSNSSIPNSSSPEQNLSSTSNTTSSKYESGDSTSVPALSPEISYETNPEAPSKQNPISFILIVGISIILGTYLTRNKE